MINRPKSLRYWLSISAITVVTIALLVYGLATEGFGGLALNLATEIVGAAIVLFLIEGWLAKASEEREAELEAIREEQARLERMQEKYLAGIQRFQQKAKEFDESQFDYAAEDSPEYEIQRALVNLIVTAKEWPEEKWNKYFMESDRDEETLELLFGSDSDEEEEQHDND